MQRFASTLRLRPESEAMYKEYHRSVWPDVLRTITECNIRNYSIFLRDGILFSYFEYAGDDLRPIWRRWLQIRKHRNGGPL